MAVSHDHAHPHEDAAAVRPAVVRPWADPYLDIEAYDPEGDLLVLNLGPQHPSTHGVFRVKLWLDGEVCIKAVPYAGYLHRGVEKLCEKLAYVQITPVVDKNDYLSAFTNELAVNIAFEALNDVTPPRRASARTRWWGSTRAPTGRSASSTTSSACTSPDTLICAAS